MIENEKVILYKTASTAQFPEDFQSRFHTHIYCQSGTIKFNFNNRQFHCKKGEFVFWLAGLSVTDISFSVNFKAIILLVENNLLTNNLPSATVSIDAYIHSKENPILHPDKQDKEKILKNFQLLYDKSKEVNHRFYEELLKLQMQVFLLEMWHIFEDELDRKNEVYKAEIYTKSFYN
ncbi:MAG: hypothetical protein HC892_21385 [Saprospiraceae bacterium]|nr:hypothetical protein [Saprospiraceae bacterium]